MINKTQKRMKTIRSHMIVVITILLFFFFWNYKFFESQAEKFHCSINIEDCEQWDYNISEIDTSIVPHPECELQTGNFCPGIGIVKLPCNRKGECVLDDSGITYIGCEYRTNICVSNQTICKKCNMK